MAKAVENGRTGRGFPWRAVGWGTAALLLLLPLIAMRFTQEVNWSASDFLVMGVLFGGVGLAFEFIVRRSSSGSYRFGAAIALLAAFLTIWVNGAVGMIGDEDNPLNLMFGGVLIVALAGAAIARLRPAGMARAMVAAAVAQAGVSAIGLSIDPRGGVLSMAFAGLWLLSAALFREGSPKQDAIHLADGA